MYSKVEIITPDAATAYLERNTNNRPKKEKRIKMYAADMKAGRWQLSPDGISFYTDKSLANGQNRLAAVILANTPVEMYVTYDVPKSTTVFDTGATRSPSDILHLAGYKQSNLNAATKALRFLFFICSVQNVSPATMGSVIDLYEDKFEAASRTISNTHAHKKEEFSVSRNRSCHAANFTLLLAGEDEQIVAEFWECIRSGLYDSPSKSAAIIYRNYLLTEYKSKNHGIAVEEESFAMALMAFNDFKNGVARQRRYKVEMPIVNNAKVGQWLYVKNVILSPFTALYNGKAVQA